MDENLVICQKLVRKRSMLKKMFNKSNLGFTSLIFPTHFKDILLENSVQNKISFIGRTEDDECNL